MDDLLTSIGFFEQRAAELFPKAGVSAVDDPRACKERLLAFLRAPLSVGEAAPIWLVPGGGPPGMVPVERAEALDGNRVLLGARELAVKRLFAYRDGAAPFRNLVYVECDADRPTGLYPEAREAEEFALAGGAPKSLAELEAGKLQGAAFSLRVRMLKPCAYFIVPQLSPLTTFAFDARRMKVLRALLDGKPAFADWVQDDLARLPPHPLATAVEHGTLARTRAFV